MATTHTKTTKTKKSRPAKSTAKTTSKAGKKAGSRARSATAQSAVKSASQSPGDLIAERYRDIASGTLAGTNGEDVSAAMNAGEAMLAGMAEVSQEMMTFAGERLRQDLETAEDFARCTTPQELFEKQRSFAERAAQQYAEETSKLVAMFARIQQSCWAPVQARTKEALEGMDGEPETEK